ncbi:hypothetical protein AYO21_06292 [Fonsecaea monophora]|uniref:Uncharacterized protein n=1 Tax=Fonsecaea monophora TaxID=254056 RepID=A0A177F5H2_9EURO|nr:hypothetical protein AYO21_06292 [Fonsecaea monophora]OAG39464.1 hypothetical protein AYO21_06292 [Fonsecaea monophora]
MRARKRSGEEIATPISPRSPGCSSDFAATLWPESSKHAHFHDLLAAIVGDRGYEHRPEVFDHYDAESVAWADSLGFHRIGSSIWIGRGSQPKSLMMREDPYHPPTFVRPIKDTLPKSILGELNDVGFLEAAHNNTFSRSWLTISDSLLLTRRRILFCTLPHNAFSLKVSLGLCNNLPQLL